ncbi:centromere protein P [Centropristis striata]|uniref:centromere protein P n=1 Tax=Centropristis striata TaxID=184440 RepID=UPI0027E1868C|nr:centromere protein P [Centropristis striata]
MMEKVGEENSEEVKVLEENSEEVKVLEDQIQHLQAEVEALQHHQQDNQKDRTLHCGGHLQDAMWYLCGQKKGGGGAEQVVSRLKEEVEELEEDLKLQTQINSISVKSCSTKTLRSSSRELVQQLCISGRCSELVFHVEFQLSELKEGEEAQRTISDLNVVMDTSDLDLNSFLSGVEETRDLLLLFRTLRTFSDRCDDRRRTFQHFQEKYPSVVSLPGGCRSEVMTLNHPDLPGCVLFIHWSIEVSGGGGVSPKIELQTKIPDEALQLFPSQPVGGAAAAFQSLLRILGAEAAMESVIMAVGLLTND